MSPGAADIQAFRAQGFVHIPGFLGLDQVADLRARCLAHFAAGHGRVAERGRIEADIPNRMPDIAWLLTHPPALDAARKLLGTPTLLHPHESAVHLGPVNRGWHKDARDYANNDPNGSDWREDYRVLHFVYYLQDHVDHSGGLSVKRGSHRIRNHVEGQPVTIANRAGDLVAFDLRTTHSGNTLRVRPELRRLIPERLVLPIPWRRFVRRALQPERLLQPLLWRIPGLFLPSPSERLAIFFVYGADDAHTRNFFEYLKKRPDYGHLAQYAEPLRVG